MTEKCAKVCKRAMAEWIVERPGNGTYPLADYKKVDFKGAKADGTPTGSGGISAFPDVFQPRHYPRRAISARATEGRLFTAPGTLPNNAET